MNALSPIQHTRNLLDFIDKSPSPWHVVKTVETQLNQFQFQKLDETQTWQLKTGGRYYVTRDDSSIIAFVCGQKSVEETGLKIIGAHTDSPSLRVKPKPQTETHHLERLNVEIYGSPILATFADRDLSLAGRVSFKKNGKIQNQLIHIENALLRLPNLAIHVNRNVNEEGLKIHKQHELSLFYGSINEQLPQNDFLKLLTLGLNTDFCDILTWDLNVYDTQKGAFWGTNQEFYANSQIDNLASCHAAISAFLNETVLNADSTLVCAFFDHEEVGSESYCGAGGSFLQDTLKRIALNSAEDSYLKMLSRSFMISADMAHAYHPNCPHVYDSNHAVYVNQGVVIKVNANQRYTSNSISEAVFIECCERANVPYQFYSHRNDLPCGSTIGSILAAKLGMRCVDVGNPMWAMHSIRESAGVLDHAMLISVFETFFKS